MSSILKALKKLEREKTVRKPDSFRIDAEILRGGARRSFFSAGTSLAAIALFLCGVGATYLIMKPDQSPVPVQQSQVPINEIKSEASPVTTQLPASSSPAAGPPPYSTGNEIYVSQKTELSHRPVVKQVQSPKEKPAETVPAGLKPASPPVPDAAVSVPAKPATLKVNGIAFQEGADSVAVVNGITVSIGSVIEGARVEEIQKDRVRFSRSDVKFDIILDKTN
jgi:general secretion pathway protein B